MKKKVLLIEDESSIADNIRYALETEGFEATWKSTAAEGLKSLEQNLPQLIILDVGLPDTNGFELCREIRKKYSIPIIFLTARSEEVDRIVGLEIGADDYMTKPFSPRELAARVKAVLRRGESTVQSKTSNENPKHSYGPFEIDEDKCRILYHGNVLELTRYEYKLLRALVERPGRVLSRDQLMEIAWDSPESSLDRTIDAHIKSLRAKMKKINEAEEAIQTHRGLGYSLKDEW